MPLPLSVQLYTLRAELAKDFAGTIRKVADIGYAGVETAGFPGTTPKEAAKLFKDLGLQVVAAHAPLPVGDKKNETLDNMATLGAPYLVCAWLDPQKYYQTPDQVKAAADLLNEANTVAKANNLTMVYHNHDFEYKKIDGQYIYQLLLKGLDPAVQLELDAYWVRTAGVDPAQVLKELGPRIPLLHVKDGPAERGKPMTAVGEGVLDYSAIIKPNEKTIKHLILELDECATDMMTAVEKSYRYLIDKGLAHGRKN